MAKYNRTKFTVLGMLTIKPMSGYEIAKQVRSSTQFFWSESEGQIYPALIECLSQGLTTCQEQASEKSPRSKKIYAITPEGRKLLNSWLCEKSQNCLVRDELLLKLFFGQNIDFKDNCQHLIQREKEIEALLKTYEAIHQEITSEKQKSKHLPYWLMTLKLGIENAKTELKWCQETLTELENLNIQED